MAISRAESSRLNGAQSAGPVTEQGRAVSSQNALKLGIYTKRRFINDERPEDFAALVDELARSFNPASPIEWMFIDRMAMVRWRIARLERGESAQIELAQTRYLYASDQEKWERFGGRSLAVRLSSAPAEVLKEIAPVRDTMITASLGIPVDFEKFARVSAALHREFDTALRALREEQARRVGTLEMIPSATSRHSTRSTSDGRTQAVEWEVDN